MSSNKQRSSNKTHTTSLFFFDHPALSYLLKWLPLCLLIGVCTGSASAFFLQSLDLVTGYREHHVWIIAFLPVAGFLIGCLYHYKGKESNEGNRLLIETVHRPGKIIPLMMAPLVYIGTVTTHLFGGAAGREGTALQMSGALADQFSKPFGLTGADRKILVIAAIAAGFGSVFGTPFAGAIFGVEVCFTGKIKFSALLPALASSLIADQVTRLWNTHHTVYPVLVLPDFSFVKFLYTVIAGIVFGLCATVFIRLIHFITAAFKSHIVYPPLRPLLGGVIVAAAVWIMGTTTYIGLGIPTILASFNQQMPSYSFLLKMLFTVVTLGAGFKGGEVTPLFFIGAVLGSALAAVIPLPTALLAGLGFVAVFAGATNTPLACSIMAMELFGIECGIYTAIACFVAYFFSGKNTIYGSQKLQNEQMRYLQQKEKLDNL